MELIDLRVGMMGFNKNDVCEYISELNNNFSDQLSSQKRESERSLAHMNEKNEELNSSIVRLETEKDELNRKLEKKDEVIAQLQSEIEQIKKQISDERQKHNSIADILLDAKDFADGLRAKAVSENEALRQENLKEYNAERKRISEYRERVDKVKSTLIEALRSMEAQTDEINGELSDLQNGKNGEIGNEW